MVRSSPRGSGGNNGFRGRRPQGRQGFGFLQEGNMGIETVGFVQIATAATPKGAVLYGLTTSGVVYEYNYSREVWIPLPMRALPENGSQEIGRASCREGG